MGLRRRPARLTRWRAVGEAALANPGALLPVEEGFERLLAIVAHPDDLEYGAGSAVARWTSQGKVVGYVIATSGEAGIDGIEPAQARSIREAEQRASAEIVGVESVRFLGYPDGVVEPGLGLRRDLAREIRTFRPDVLLLATCALTFGGNMLNQSDHRVVGVAALDAARDAANRWVFPELVLDGQEPWGGTSDVYVMGSNHPTHGVDVTDFLDYGIASLRAHRAYTAGLGRDFDAEAFIEGFTAKQGEMFGSTNAVVFEHLSLAGM